MLLLGCMLALLLPPLTESVTISLPPTDNTIILIKRVNNATPPCYICAPSCKESSLEISRGKKVDYVFSCKTPELYFIMEINRTIDCSLGVCPLNISLQPSNLDGLNRTFIWNILTSKNNGLVLGFSTPWRQIHPSNQCSDLVDFKISTYVRDSSYSIGTFCRNGTITRIKVQERGVISLSLPWNVSIKDPGISITNRSSIRRLSIVESTFHHESTVTLLSANYPAPFPHNEQMTWKFIFPQNYAASVQFLNYTLPMCVKKEENVLYYIPTSKLLKLMEKQPGNILSNFNVSLQNCEVDRQMTSHPGLSLKFNVTVQKSNGSELFNLDLLKENGLVVRIRKRFMGRTFTPVCFICKGPSDCDNELELQGGKFYKISFNCDRESLVVTAEKQIECWNLSTCNISNMPLTIPESFITFPVQLESFTWKLIAPVYISTEIVSKSIYLQQSVLDKPCNASSAGFTYDILSCTNKNSFKLGTFCPNGSMQKIQMRDNVTITLNVPRDGKMQKLLTHDLAVSFVSFIEEESIFTLSPKTEETIYIQTPQWDEGLPDYVSVSWNINVPKKQSGRLKFAKDRLDLSCEMGRAYVNIKEQTDNGPGIVRRDDQQLPGPLDMYSTFWVNISNCKPWARTKKLTLQFSVTFNQVSPVLKIILISVASAVAVVLTVIVTVCCIKRKRKKQIEAPVGIYNSKVNTEAPRRQAFFKKGRKTNESHIYAVIDDSMVYGHLLQETTNGIVPEVDVYHPFEGPMDAPPVPPITFSKRIANDDGNETSIKEDLKDGNINGDIMDDPLALSMKENEIYIFSKSISRQPVENEDTSIPYMDDSQSGTMSSV